MTRSFLPLALGAALALAASAAHAQPTPANTLPPPFYDSSQRTQYQPVAAAQAGKDSGTGAWCIVGASATCQPIGGGVLPVATTDKSGTIATGGTAQTGIALNAARKSWCIQNPSTATAEGIATAESLWVRVNGTAAVGVGTELTPGNQACNAPGSVDTAAVSIFAATTGHKFNGFEAQ